MTSERKIAANRMNAKKSCGPQSAAGKRRVRQNALRHGLAAAPPFINLPHDIERTAKAICAGDINPLLFEQARVIAESETVLRCVRAQWVAVIERLRDVTVRPLAERDNGLALARARMEEMEPAWAEFVQLRAKFDALPAEEMRKLADECWEMQESESRPAPARIEERDEIDAMREAMPDLRRLARYERRAWSRRKRAIRTFIEIKLMSLAIPLGPPEASSVAAPYYNHSGNKS